MQGHKVYEQPVTEKENQIDTRRFNYGLYQMKIRDVAYTKVFSDKLMINY